MEIHHLIPVYARVSVCVLACVMLSSRSLKLECEKLASEKTEMQRHYIMVSPVTVSPAAVCMSARCSCQDPQRPKTGSPFISTSCLIRHVRRKKVFDYCSNGPVDGAQWCHFPSCLSNSDDLFARWSIYVTCRHVRTHPIRISGEAPTVWVCLFCFVFFTNN